MRDQTGLTSRDLKLSKVQDDQAKQAFAEVHTLNGGEGYFRLGQIFLHNPAQEPGNDGYPELSEPRFIDHADDFDNDFLTSVPEYEKAYAAMHKAVLCNVTAALQWERYIETQGNFDLSKKQTLQRIAESDLNAAAKQTIGGISDHCEGKTFRQRINQLSDPAVIWRFINDRRAWPTMLDLTYRLRLPEAEFQHWVGVLIDESFDLYGFGNQYPVAPYGASPNLNSGPVGSQYYRTSPGADTDAGAEQPPTSTVTMNSDCAKAAAAALLTGDNHLKRGDRAAAKQSFERALFEAQKCQPPENALIERARGRLRELNLACADQSRAWVSAGDASLYIGNTREAKRLYDRALTEGRLCAASAAETAQKRLRAINLTCEYNAESLDRISRGVLDVSADAGGGSVIKMRARQSALKSHGYYDGPIDGRYGAKTREAVRRFQNDFAFEETGDLTPIETVYLMCSAATIQNDPPSMNTLGIMYLTGLGTVQSIDAGLRQLKRAADDHDDPDALFNLATLYGLGTVEGSYKLCAIPENLQQADAYLEQAAEMGHPQANAVIDLYQNEAPSVRWRLYGQQWIKNGFFSSRLINVPEGCTPS